MKPESHVMVVVEDVVVVFVVEVIVNVNVVVVLVVVRSSVLAA
jgi:hypothetical protein